MDYKIYDVRRTDVVPPLPLCAFLVINIVLNVQIYMGA